MTGHRIFGITGWKNAGKTTLTTRLVTELTARGYTIATVKHAHHAFDIDHPGTDSFRHREAGAREVAIVSGARWALMHEMRDEAEPSLDAIIARLSPCDIVLVEGYKRESHPKIEVRRAAAGNRPDLAPDDPKIVAIAADQVIEDCGISTFHIDDIAAIADFIEKQTGLGMNRRPTSPAR